MLDIEYRSWPIEELRVSDEDGAKRVEWYASVFDSPSENMWGVTEFVGRRAFTKTLQEHDIRALFNHDPNLVLGRNKADTLKLHVDTKGLRASVTPPDTQWARDLMVSVERGDVSAGSFGFQVLKDDIREGPDGGIIRELKEVRLFDVSLVTYPAFPGTDGTASVRSLLGIDLQDLAFPILNARAGKPLGAEERERFDRVMEQLRKSLPEPPRHSIPVSVRRRELELLALRS